MERRNNPHHSTADLLSWSQSRLPAANRSKQPSDGISDVLGGGSQITKEEAQSLNNNVSYRKNCSGHKLKEMVGSDIFSDFGNVVSTHTSRIHYQQDQHSQISFSGQETPSPKKPTTLAKAAKQKELSRTLQAQPDSTTKKKQLSNFNIQATTHDIFASPLPPETQADSTSKKKLLSNCRMQATHDIFASPLPSETQPRPQQLQRDNIVEEPAPASVKATSGQSGHRVAGEQVVGKSSNKFQQVTSNGKRPSNGKLTSNGIFKCDKIPPGYSEKMHSSAKLREMSGHNIFADGKSEYRDYYGGTRRPPGGESSISLV